MNHQTNRIQVLALLSLSACMGGALLYEVREWRLRQLIPPLDKELTAIDTRRRLREDALLPVGVMAPDFELKTLRAEPLTLKELRRSNKAILINFWFYGCGPCQEELPLLTAFHTTFGDRGLAIVAVNNSDSKSVLRQWVLHNHVRFPVVTVGKPSSATRDIIHTYRVSAYPTNYLIAANGRVLWRGVGVAEESSLRAALMQAGISQARSVPLIYR